RTPGPARSSPHRTPGPARSSPPPNTCSRPSTEVGCRRGGICHLPPAGASARMPFPPGRPGRWRQGEVFGGPRNAHAEVFGGHGRCQVEVFGGHGRCQVEVFGGQGGRRVEVFGRWWGGSIGTVRGGRVSVLARYYIDTTPQVMV